MKKKSPNIHSVDKHREAQILESQRYQLAWGTPQKVPFPFHVGPHWLLSKKKNSFTKKNGPQFLYHKLSESADLTIINNNNNIIIIRCLTVCSWKIGTFGNGFHEAWAWPRFRVFGTQEKKKKKKIIFQSLFKNQNQKRFKFLLHTIFMYGYAHIQPHSVIKTSLYLEIETAGQTWNPRQF